MDPGQHVSVLNDKTEPKGRGKMSAKKQEEFQQRWEACFVFSEFSKKRLSHRLAEATVLCSVKGVRESDGLRWRKPDGCLHHLFPLLKRRSSKRADPLLGW